MMTKIVLTLALVTMISVTPAFAASIAVEVDGAIKLNNAISYTSSGIDLEHVSADLESISMIFQVSVSDSVEEGDLTVTFARDIFDAKIADVDDEFFIIADGDEIKFEEEKDNESRTLSFSIPSGTEEFEIFGTILFDESFLLQLEAAKEAVALKKEEDRKYFYEVLQPQLQANVAKINERIAAEAAEKEAEELAKQEEARLLALMATCGDGTVYADGECINAGLIGPQPEPVDSGPLINSIFAAMGIGLAVMLILWAIGRGRHKERSIEVDDS